MRHRLFTRMLVIYLSIIFLIISSLALGLTYFLQDNYFGQKERQLRREAQEISNLFSAFNRGDIGRKELDRAVNSLAEVSNTRVFLLNGDQNLINKTLELENNSQRAGDSIKQDIHQILKGKTISRKRQFSSTLNTDVAFVGQPLRDDQGKVQGVLLLYSPLTETTVTLNYLYRIIWQIALGGLLIGGLATFFVSRRISTPIVAMSTAFAALAKGQQQDYVTVKGRDEVAELAASFNYMKDELAKTELIRRDFIAAVSHELRTPLTSIRGFVQALRDGMVPHEQQPHYLQIALTEADRMTRLINELMDLVKMQAGVFSLKLECLDLVQISSEVVTAYQTIAQTRGVTLLVTSSDPIKVWADMDRVKQILSNLIANSLRYTGTGGTISVVVNQSDKWGILLVVDSGCGISAEDLPYIFDKFYRVDKAREVETGGSGIGLSIVKQLVELHGGEIEARSVLQQGTTIEVRFRLCS